MIAVVGHTAIDHLFRVPKLPGRHNSTYITEHSVYFGGGAANIAAGIATLGERCRLVSLVGETFRAAITTSGCSASVSSRMLPW